MAEEILDPVAAPDAELPADPPVAETPPAEPPVADPVPPAEAPPEPPPEAEAPKLDVVSVQAVKNRFYNPFTKVYFEQFEVVENAVLDSWLQSQLDAGYIKKV